MNNIQGIIIKFNDNDAILASDIQISEEDTKKIMAILEKPEYVDDGFSIRGTLAEIKDEIESL